jgi:DNA-binding Lrp family transcriptional regulator
MRIRKKYLFYVLAFTSTIIAAGVSAIDATINSLFIPNAFAFTLSCFLVGSIITFIILLFFSIPVEKTKSIGTKIIDPSFNRIRLIRKNEIKYHIIAGFGNAILTIGYISLISILRDPSTVLPFTQIVILYLVIIESIIEKDTPTLIEIQSALIVTFGAIIGSISLTGEINLLSLAIVFLIVNPAWVIFSIYQRKLKLLKIDDKPNDSLNIRFWNVIFACIFTTIIIITYDFFMGTQNLIQGINVSIKYFNLVSLTMIVTFFSFVFYIRALGIGKASVTQAVRATIVILTIPFSLILSFLNIIPPFTTDPVMILLKIIGTILVLLGIVSFAFSLLKAYVFINVHPGFSIQETMDKLWNIKGVTRVTAVAGKYDFMIKIRIRTLMKGYEKIIKKIEEIESIKDYKWFSVLREWEDV